MSPFRPSNPGSYPDMFHVMQFLGLRIGYGVELYFDDYERDEGRYVWYEISDEVEDRVKGKHYDPIELIMEVEGVDEDGAWDWLRENELISD